MATSMPKTGQFESLEEIAKLMAENVKKTGSTNPGNTQKVSYVAQVHTYVYVLPCEHRFHSQTKSVADEDGLHWFPCGQCERQGKWSTHFLTEEDMETCERVALTKSGSRKLGDGEIAKQLDQAMIRDRIADRLRETRGRESSQTVAADFDVTDRTVRTIAQDLGIHFNRGEHADDMWDGE